MMIFTHALVGILLAALVSLTTSVPPASLVAAGAAGGLLPDADMAAMHRKTFHFPVGFSVAAGLAVVASVVTASTVAVLVAVAAGAAAVHCWMDVLGGGKEMRPWLETDDRAVYDHLRGEWVTARRVFYDGSKPDLAVSIAAGAASGWLLPAAFDGLLAALLVLSAVYAALRRRVTEWISDDHETFSSYLQSKFT